MSAAGYFRAAGMVAMALLMIGAILTVHWPSGDVKQEDVPTNEDVGKTLFGESNGTGYGLVVLLIGLLLLVALLGGIYLAKEERE